MKVNYILFGLMLLGLGISLYLYNESKNNSIRFNERANIVKEVLFLLERTDKLKNVLRKSVFEGANTKDTAVVFSIGEKSQVDSVLNRLHNIVLYDDQRQRIDTIKKLVDYNFFLLVKDVPDLKSYKPISPLISRAQAYAERRLQEQQKEYKAQEARASGWMKLVLATSVGLFLAGVWLTIGEHTDKRRLQSLHQSILSNASIGISVLKASKGKLSDRPMISYANLGALVKTGTNDEESVVDLSSLFSQAEMISAFNVVVTSGKSITKEIEHVDARGNRLWLLSNMSRVGPGTVAFYYQDITRLKLYERELSGKVTELQAVNKELEQFAHATSHDLKEPFRKIQVMADMLKKNQNEKNHAKYLEGIVSASIKGSKLVDQILNYSKVQFDKTNLELIELEQLVKQVIDDLDLLILEKDAKVIVKDLPAIYANKVQIQQLFHNLISNALKFSSPDRRPELLVCAENSVSNKFAETEVSKFFKILVRDNGIGFDPAYSNKIFNAFERLNNYSDYPGFGLGLSLCQKIVMNHGGKIEASSIPGEGSEFIIYFPKMYS